MRRRRFLAALGGGASLGLGGLLTYRASRTRTLSVASVETYDAAFRLDDHPQQSADVESTDSLDGYVDRAVTSAIDGGYQTDDPAADVSEFRDRTAFVRHDGVPYRLSDTFPRLVVTAEPLDGDPSSPAVATVGRFYEVVRRYGDVDADTFLAHAQLGGVVERDPERRLRDYFDSHDAVEVGSRHYRLSATYRDPGSPYSLTAERVSEETVNDALSVALADVDRPARESLRAALDEEGNDVRGLVDPSPELVTRLRATNFLRADGSFYHVDAWRLDHRSLSVTATASESGIGFKDPGRIVFAVENTGDQPVPLYGGSTGPFGRLRYRPTDGDGRERHLYPLTDRSSSLWPTTRSTHGHEPGELRSGQRRRVEYALGGDAVGVPSGRYVVDGSVDTERDYREGRFPFRVVLDVE